MVQARLQSEVSLDRQSELLLFDPAWAKYLLKNLFHYSACFTQREYRFAIVERKLGGRLSEVTLSAVKIARTAQQVLCRKRLPNWPCWIALWRQMNVVTVAVVEVIGRAVMMSALPPIVLQNSFWITEDKFPGFGRGEGIIMRGDRSNW